MNPAMWELASSMIAVGLSWSELPDSFQALTDPLSRTQALAAISVGHIIIAAVIVLNGTMGARLHIAFPAS